MGFSAYGFRFPTHRAACRYRALVRMFDVARVSPDARLRLAERFIAKHGGWS